jgi:hypothetical protein
VKRVVWRRDAGQCAYVAAGGRRCSEKTFLEFQWAVAPGPSATPGELRTGKPAA